MSHPRFVSAMSAIVSILPRGIYINADMLQLGILAWMQYHRIGMVTETRKDQLGQAHLK